MNALIEEAANNLELRDDRFREAADLLRRIELERGDAARKALEGAIKSIESLEDTYKNDIYRKAWKVAAQSIRTLILGVK